MALWRCGAVGLRRLAAGERRSCGEQLIAGEQFNIGQQPSAPKWPAAEVMIEVWYKNPGRASTFGGSFTTPILPGQTGSSGRIPLERSGEVTFVPMINNADGNVIWAPDSVTITVPTVP